MKSSTLFLNAFEKSSIMMIISERATGKIIHANEKFLKTMGYAPDEVLGLTSKKLRMYANYDQRVQLIRQLEQHGKVSNYEVEIRNKDGALYRCLVSLSSLVDSSDDYLFLCAIDITELRNSEFRLKHVFNQQSLLANVTRVLNSTWNVHEVLNEVLKMLGIHTGVSRVYLFENTMDEKRTKNTHEWCNQGILSQIEFLQDVDLEELSSWLFLLKRDGRILSNDITQLPEDLVSMLITQGIVSILVYPIFIKNRLHGFIGFDECTYAKKWSDENVDLLLTVTNVLTTAIERQLYVEELRFNQVRLDLALQSAEEGLWDWDILSGDLYFNDVWCEMLGYKREDFEPNVESWKIRVHPDDIARVTALLNAHMMGETPRYNAIYRQKHKDGNWKWVLDNGQVVAWDAEGKPTRAIGIILDITKQKEYEASLLDMNATKNKLFSIIAHDLRGPIGNFLPILDLLTMKSEMGEEDYEQLIAELKISAKSTFELLENLLNWSKSQSEGIQLHPTNIDVSAIVSENVEMMRLISSKKNIQIDFTAKKPLYAYAEKDSVDLVVRNLINNAIKFTENGGLIRVSVSEKPEFITIKVSDNGVGMSEEIREKLFGQSVVSSSRGTNNEKGSGLGLALCKDFVQRNGGEIFVESTLGMGSTFMFTLPKFAASVS